MSLLLALCGALAAPADLLRWEPQHLTVRLLPGTTVSRQVSLVSSRPVAAAMAVQGGLGVFLPPFPAVALPAAEPVVFTLSFVARAGQPLGSYSGSILVLESFLRGNTNGDEKVDLSDAVSTLSFLFSGGPAATCPDAADANDDGTVDISDPVFTLGFLFLGGPSPPPPFPTAGADPSADPLACAAGAALPVAVEVGIGREPEVSP